MLEQFIFTLKRSSFSQDRNSYSHILVKLLQKSFVWERKEMAWIALATSKSNFKQFNFTLHHFCKIIIRGY